MTNSRPRNADNTKLAILQAARLHFAQDSFERVGLREIASSAGVNAALIIRYFGSKEQLFTQAITQLEGETNDIQLLFGGERNRLGQRLAQYVMGKNVEDQSFNSLLALLRSAPNQTAGAILRTALETQFIQPLTQYLGGDNASLRASLIAAHILGVAVIRNLIQVETLTSSNSEVLLEQLERNFQVLIDNL
jgi:AcrR family transcriptional regulator